MIIDSLKILCILSALVLLLSSCTDDPENPRFEVLGIEQAGIFTPSTDNAIQIRNSPFSIIIKTFSDDCILINASFKSQSLVAAENGAHISEIDGFSSTGMAEFDFNRNRDIMISNEAPSCWYVKNENDHRCNQIKKTKGGWVCRRDIDNITIVPDGLPAQSPFPIDELTEPDMYLVFVSSEWARDFSSRKELQRDWLRISFE